MAIGIDQASVHQELTGKGRVTQLLKERIDLLAPQRPSPAMSTCCPCSPALGAAGPVTRERAIHRGIRNQMIAMDSPAFERG